MATWDVKLFAYLREQYGSSVTIEAEPNVTAILQALTDKGIKTDSCRLAIGDEFGRGNQAVPLNSKLSLIPPVSGG